MFLILANTQAAAANASMLDRMLDSVEITLVGMGIVFISLWIIGEIMGVVGRLMAREEQPEPTPQAVPSPPAASFHSGVDPETLAVLTAAAVAALGRHDLRIQRVTLLRPNTISAWADMGRVAIHTSHNLRRNM